MSLNDPGAQCRGFFRFITAHRKKIITPTTNSIAPAKARNATKFLAAYETAMRGADSRPLEEWREQWLAWGRDWIKNIAPLPNG